MKNQKHRRGWVELVGQPVKEQGWLSKFIARIRALTTGRYCIILTIGQTWADWTIIELGKVEQASK